MTYRLEGNANFGQHVEKNKDILFHLSAAFYKEVIHAPDFPAKYEFDNYPLKGFPMVKRRNYSSYFS